MTLGGLKVKNQLFAEVTKENGVSFILAKFSGILGLAFPSLAVTGATPVWNNLVSQGLVKDNSFSFYLSNDQDTQQPDAGAFVLGGVDSKYYSGEFSYTPLAAETYWLIDFDDFGVDGKSSDWCKSGKCQAAVDTGTHCCSCSG